MKMNRNQLVLPFNYEAIIDENDAVWKLVSLFGFSALIHAEQSISE